MRRPSTNSTLILLVSKSRVVLRDWLSSCIPSKFKGKALTVWIFYKAVTVFVDETSIDRNLLRFFWLVGVTFDRTIVVALKRQVE